MKVDQKHFHQEQKKLDTTINRIEDQTFYIWELLDRKKQQFKEQTSFIGDSVSYKLGKSDKDKLGNAINQPYFGRIDIVEDGVEETFYIGKHGVRDRDEQIIVVDWRMPMATTYYNFMPGKPQQNYTVIDKEGRKHVSTIEVLQKREFTIKDRKIKKILQQVSESSSDLNILMTDKGEQLMVTDDFLRDILENSESTGYLKEIIATIQKEQDTAIRQSIDANVVIQGVAGSGKSSIALHRLSYLLFNNKNLKPEELLILGPSNLFISSTKGMLPDLDLDGIRQSTFQELVFQHLKPFIPSKVNLDYSTYFDDVLFSPGYTEEKDINEFKGSVAFLKILDTFVNEFQNGYEDRFKPIKIFDEQLLTSKLVEIYEGYAYLPFIKRTEKFVNHIENHYKRMLDIKIKEVDDQHNMIEDTFLKNTGLDEVEFKALLTQIRTIADYKIKKLKQEYKLKMAEWKRTMALPNPFKIYQQVLSYEILDNFKRDIGNEIPQLFKGYKIDEVTYFDLAPLYYIYLLMFDPPEKFAHIVIDEAQDLSFIHFAILKKITKTVTILGDKEQSIFLGYGQYNWNELMRSLFNEKKYMLLSLDTSYRSTKQIIDVANTVLGNHYEKNKFFPITPLNRSGPDVTLERVLSGRDLLEGLVSTITSWKKKYKRIAVIHKDERKALQLAAYLSNQFGQEAIYVNPNTEVKQGYVSVLASYYSKGMEFDAVLIVNANDESFPNDELHARLLYVLLTRAQQEAKVYYQDTPSSLLQGLVPERTLVTSEFDDIL
jgi:DNA helicase II / ATP-dependent DNA helicase PcrA